MAQVWKYISVCLSCALLLSTTACVSTFGETRYFRVVDASGKAANYYRIDICGSCFLSSSKYQSGLFNEQGVDAYFGQYTQPSTPLQPADATKSVSELKPAPGSVADGKLAAGNGTTGTTTTAKPTGSQAQSITDTSLDGSKLVLLFSSNSDDIASQIGTFGQSDDFTTDLAAVFGKQTTEVQSKAQLQLRQQQAACAEVVAQGNDTVGSLSKDSDAATAKKQALAFANILAGYLGSTETFDTLEKAQAWVQKNGVQVLKEKQ